ncbi:MULTISPECIES: SCO family protein [Alteribacter]|uniref:SCO family protein n=1 Tax=Alteribacter keqinensis TaxID=2483800 RepID=A0A3M7TWT4_9BACI|nr:MULTISPECIES: SCO family protein [Alteribacter]MBM7097879.1 SCO family protein [Alteribacter salitolerans]RNA70058.1 SCO family protein [Alteribacter keqinensis]
MKQLVFLASLVSLAVLAGCSFLYSDPASETDSIVDLTEVEREEEHQWRMPEFEAVNQNGETVTNEDLEGSLTLVKTIFTRCPTVCMTMTPNMVQVQEAMDEEGIEGVNIVSFTVDPDFDTPERLETYAESYGAHFDNWQLLTGYEESFLNEDLAPALFTRIQPVENDIVHPTRFFLFDENGDVIRLYNGEQNFELDSLIEDLKYIQR